MNNKNLSFSRVLHVHTPVHGTDARWKELSGFRDMEQQFSGSYLDEAVSLLQAFPQPPLFPPPVLPAGLPGPLHLPHLLLLLPQLLLNISELSRQRGDRPAVTFLLSLRNQTLNLKVCFFKVSLKSWWSDLT